MGELHDCAQEQRLPENSECATKYSLNGNRNAKC